LTIPAKKSILKKLMPYLVFACVLLAFVPYFDSLSGAFVFDDLPLIQKDPFYLQESNPLKCWQRDFWKEGREQGLYRPLTVFTYWLNVKISGISSPAFRITNLLIHIFAVLLIFKLVIRLKFGHMTAIFAAALFAVHPIHTEAVIPAFGRGELLCAIFLFLALIIHTYSDKYKYAFIPAGISFLFACWSKEHGIVFLPICFLADMYLKKPFSLPQFRNYLKAAIPAYVFYTSVAAVYLLSRYSALKTFLPSKSNFIQQVDNPIALCHFPLNFISALKVQGFALSQFFWPAVLSHDYSYAQILPSVSVLDLKAWLTVLLFIGIPLLVSLYFKNMKYKMLFLVLAYAICIIPAGNFIVMTGTIFGERLQYIPSLWICIFSAAVMTSLLRRIRFKIAVLLVLAVLIAYSARTYIRGKDWDSQMSLAVAGVNSAPKSVKTWNNLAMELGAYAGILKDASEKMDKYREAIAACDKGLSIYPDYVTLLVNRGIYYSLAGCYIEAEKDLRKAVRLAPGMFEASYILGALLAEQGRLTEAKDIWDSIRKISPDNPILKNAYEKLSSEIEEKKKADGKSD
jgi:tetratricopeptide (TPR) repeat protein